MVTVIESTVLRKVDIGVEGGRPVNSLIGAILFLCGDGALLMALLNILMICGQSSRFICNSLSSARVTRRSYFPIRFTAPFDHGQREIWELEMVWSLETFCE